MSSSKEEEKGPDDLASGSSREASVDSPDPEVGNSSSRPRDFIKSEDMSEDESPSKKKRNSDPEDEDDTQPSKFKADLRDDATDSDDSQNSTNHVDTKKGSESAIQSSANKGALEDAQDALKRPSTSLADNASGVADGNSSKPSNSLEPGESYNIPVPHAGATTSTFGNLILPGSTDFRLQHPNTLSEAIDDRSRSQNDNAVFLANNFPSIPTLGNSKVDSTIAGRARQLAADGSGGERQTLDTSVDSATAHRPTNQSMGGLELQRPGSGLGTTGLESMGFGASSSIMGYPPTFIPRQLGVEDALAYLDKVKRQFHDRLEVYNQFLEIMKNFKSHAIDTPGVITHVCELFKGHNNLILGFNTFLPPGFKIEWQNHSVGPTVGGRPVVTHDLTLLQQQQLMEQQIAQQQLNNVRSQGMSKVGPAGLSHSVHKFPQTFPNGQTSAAAGRDLEPPQTVVSSSNAATPSQMLPTEDPTDASTIDGQPVEFDQAINYVTKIKRRFADDTDTYKTFLDILHSYQNEKRSIKEVLEQVSDLFKDQLDLLKEFTYFLPDTVRESAKSELVKKAAKAKARERRMGRSGGTGTGKGDRGVSMGLSDSDYEENWLPQLERNLLGRIKAALGTRALWGEFLKCLDLFAQKLISRAELLALISDVFGERADLLEEFDRLLASRGATDDPIESAWFSMPLTDIDFANCRRCSPSYRALPAAYPKAPCSERTAMCRSVLNDTWVSVPFGSEDSNGKNHRRNQYLEALFKCEDDRYEVDMIIDSNKSAIRALEPLAREIEALNASGGPGNKFRYRLEKRTLSVIHLKAVARIYGDHGTEILELLRRNPAGAIPVILKRIKEKDMEWSQAKIELNKGWKEITERNFAKSLDYRSYYFKQTEKRNFTQKFFLAELREKRDIESSTKDLAASTRAAEESLSQPDDRSTDADKSSSEPSMEDTEATSAGQPSLLDHSDHMTLDFVDTALHRNLWGLIAIKVAKSCDELETEKVESFFTSFLRPLMLLPTTGPQGEISFLNNFYVGSVFEAADPSSINTEFKALSSGTKVVTPYGIGVIKAYDADRFLYKVELSFGTTLLNPSVVMASEADGTTDDPVVSFLKPKEPVRMEDPLADSNAEASKNCETIPTFCTVNAVYVFMRMYHILYDRLRQAKGLCCANAGRLRESSRSGSLDEDATISDGSDEFTRLLAILCAHVSGVSDTSDFEDQCRELLGPGGFFLFTIDKALSILQKQLCSLVADTKGADSFKAFSSFKSKSLASVSDLAEVYEAFNQHVSLPEGTYLCMRFIPGVLKSAGDLEKEVSKVGNLAIPSDSIVQSSRKLASRWSRPPRLAFRVVEKAPIPSPSVADEGKIQKVFCPCPVNVPLSKSSNESLTKEPSGDEGSKAKLSPKANPAQSSDTIISTTDQKNDAVDRLDIPVYEIVPMIVDKEIIQVVKNFLDKKSDDVVGEAKSMTSGDFFRYVLDLDSAHMKAKLPNDEQQDVSMEEEDNEKESKG